jgi:protein-S-isoprenylcysteine O-methyltransferase Ste14
MEKDPGEIKMVRKSEMTKDEMKNLIKKIVIRFLLFPVFLGLFTFLPAGTFNYWQVYVYFIVPVIPMTFALLYFLKNDPQFLERRTKTKEKEKTQRIIQIFFSVFFFSVFIVSGLDRRFGWSNVPVSMVLSSNVVVLLGYLIIFSVFKQNSYASRIVEVVKDQKVISTGFYSIVRHPMYVGFLIMSVSTPVALGSYWGLIPACVMPMGLILRILNEEFVLKRDLPGYVEYCQKTRYRLIPFVW